MSPTSTALSAGEQSGREPPVQPRIGELAVGQEHHWDTFVRKHPAGTFYHLSGWRRVVEDVLGHQANYLICEVDGEIQGILPLVQLKSWLFGNSIVSLPFLVYGGPIAATPAIEEALLARAEEIGRERGVDYIELRNRDPLLGSATGWLPSATHVTFRKPIDPDPDSNLRAIPRKQRAMIRKGEKAGLGWTLDEDVSRLHPAMLECKRNLGTPFFAKEYLAAIKSVFGEQVEILTVTRGAEAVCSVMSFRFRDEILPYYGGGGTLARDLKGNDYMYWCVMEKACRDGLRVFDYGRSQIGSGAYRFKKHWGFEPTPLSYCRLPIAKESPPDLNPSNPRFALAIRLWKRLPLPVAAALGPPLARRLA